jgi:hypothetical protein
MFLIDRSQTRHHSSEAQLARPIGFPYGAQTGTGGGPQHPRVSVTCWVGSCTTVSHAAHLQSMSYSTSGERGASSGCGCCCCCQRRSRALCRSALVHAPHVGYWTRAAARTSSRANTCVLPDRVKGTSAVRSASMVSAFAPDTWDGISRTKSASWMAASCIHPAASDAIDINQCSHSYM